MDFKPLKLLIPICACARAFIIRTFAKAKILVKYIHSHKNAK